MGDRIILCLLIIVARNAANSFYFHKPSSKLLNSESKLATDFGFSLGFQDTIPAELIVGAPRSDFIGKVYKCTIIDIEESISCRLLDIDMQKIANYSLEFNPDQNFYLGATVAANEDYFLTCAPLWVPRENKRLKGLIEPFGTCFVYEKDFVRYNGTFERLQQLGSPIMARNDLVTGGGGWNTLLDKNNKLILVAKTSFAGDIVYVPLESPLNNSKSVLEPYSIKEPFYNKMGTFTNIGRGLAAGNFFSNSTIYAFSMTTKYMTGVVGFLEYNQKRRLLKIMPDKRNNEPFVVTNKKLGTMFGAAIAADDLNKDGYSELIVGAPVQNDDENKCEQGAVYIFIGGDKNSIMKPERMRLISATKDGGRFGSAIATSDVDGDGISELFISSPYEDDGMGAVYILSGREVNVKLLRHDSKHQISLSDLESQQVLKAEGVRTFGYSLQTLSDLDENGCNELAVGSPGSDKVLLYRCVPAIGVDLSASLLGSTYVKEQADSFLVAVCVDIDHKLKRPIIGNLIVNTSVAGYDAYMPTTNLIIDLSEGKTKYCQNMMVKLSEKGEGEYDFSANIKMDPKAIELMKHTKAFNTSWVTLRHSETSKTLKIVRRCEAEDCKSNLTTSLVWSGPDDYVLGSSEKETVTVTVWNSGHQSVDSCAWVKITGAPVRRAGCRRDGEGYQCMLATPLKRDKKDTINFGLNMTTPRSSDEKLVVEVRVHENCGQSANTSHKLEIKYLLTTDQITVNGIAKDRNVTEKDILDDKIEIINDGHEYEIVNNGSVEWVNVLAVIAIDKKPFIGNYMVFISDSDCNEKNETDKILFECNLTLMPNSRRNAIATMDIQKDKILNNLIDGKLNTTSQLTLYLNPKVIPMTKNATIFFTYLQEWSIMNNKLAIILGAVALALLILAILIYVLYKVKFFKREQKKRLNVLRESVRRKSLKKPSETGEPSKPEEDIVVIEVVEEPVFEAPTTTDDEAVLIIEEKAQVHC